MQIEHCELILGEAREENDTYIHDCDVQDAVVMIWVTGRISGEWKQAEAALSAVHDLLNLAIQYLNAPILSDLRFLARIARQLSGDPRTAPVGLYQNPAEQEVSHG